MLMEVGRRCAGGGGGAEPCDATCGGGGGGAMPSPTVVLVGTLAGGAGGAAVIGTTPVRMPQQRFWLRPNSHRSDDGAHSPLVVVAVVWR